MTIKLSMMNAKKICVIPVWRRPDLLIACLATVRQAQDYRDWAFLFSADKGADDECFQIIKAFDAVKQTIKQPDHPFEGPAFNVLSAMRTAIKLPQAESILYLPEDFLVAPLFFQYHAKTWELLAKHQSSAKCVCATFGTTAIGATSWRVDEVRQIVGSVAEGFYQFTPEYMTHHWNAASHKNKTVDEIFGPIRKIGAVPPGPHAVLARHIGFYTSPDSPAGKRWASDTAGLSPVLRASAIMEMSVEQLNERRDTHVAPFSIPTLTAPVAESPSAPDPAAS